MPKQGVQKIEEWVGLGKADIHIHSNYSDGRPNIQEILEFVQNQTDLNVIAITDHDTMKGAFEAQDLMRIGNYHFELILGEEITSLEGHIAGLYLKEEIPGGLHAKEVIRRIHTQGGLAVAVHPFEQTNMQNPDIPVMNGLGFWNLIKLGKNLDAIEVVNATPTLSDENIRAGIITHTYLLQAETGSSDAHIIEAIGKGYTLFEGKTAEEFRQALLTHQTRGMYAKWTILALIKYIFFFLPKGLRILVNTIFHGKEKSSY